MKLNSVEFDNFCISHASHEACELKYLFFDHVIDLLSHASHEACELKLNPFANAVAFTTSHASHEACELKSTSDLFRQIVDKVTPRMRRVS